MSLLFSFRRAVVGIAYAILITRPLAAAAPDQPSFETLSGEALIAQLQKVENRDHALYELWRRATGHNDVSFEDFSIEYRRDTEVVVCPQGKDEAPIYLVLYDSFSGIRSILSGRYEISESKRLFAPLTSLNKPRSTHPAIDAFTADGKRIEPFGGNNVLDGNLIDLNGDGTVERIEIASYSDGEKWNAEVLHVWEVRPQAKPLLTLLLNWGSKEWTYLHRDDDGDGIQEIEIGPMTGNRINPKAVFRWNPEAGAYLGPPGEDRSHFRVLGSDNIQEQLSRLHADGAAFAPDSDSSAPVVGAASIATRKTASSRPYVPASPSSLSDKKLLELMGQGKRADDLERESVTPNYLPEGFWTMEPKQAALALVEANRETSPRAPRQVVIDDRAIGLPPDTCTLSFVSQHSGCGYAADEFYFLRVDSNGSYLVYAATRLNQGAIYNIALNRQVYDLRFLPLAHEDARRLATIIWWLDRVRSQGRNDEPSFSSYSTSVGSGGVLLRDAAGVALIDRQKTLWSDSIPECWRGEYTPETFANFANYLLARALPEHLGDEWASQGTNSRLGYQSGKALAVLEAEAGRLSDLSIRLLGWVDPAQTRVSHAVASCAVTVAGELAGPRAKPLLENILATVSASPVPERTPDTVDAERSALRTAEPADACAKSAWRKRLSELDVEWHTLVSSRDVNHPDRLRRETEVSLRKIACADAPAALQAWATSREDGCEWALQRLAALDTARYAQALEDSIVQSEPNLTQHFFDELARLDAKRAEAFATTLPPEKRALTTVMLQALRETGPRAADPRSIDALITVLLNPKSDWLERGKAIDLLAPPYDPLLYPQRQVDEALFRVLKPDMADDSINFTLAYACRALARRGRVEAFDQIEKLIASLDDKSMHIYEDLLGALVHLAQTDPDHLNPRVAALVGPQLEKTNKNINVLLWAIWSSDLRQFQPRLEQLATESAADYEDEKAYSYGSEVTPVLGHFHLARKIADAWRADDAPEQARLLAAFACANRWDFSEKSHPERVVRLKLSLEKSETALSGSGRRRVEDLLHLANKNATDSRTKPDEEVQRLHAAIRTSLGLQEPARPANHP